MPSFVILHAAALVVLAFVAVKVLGATLDCRAASLSSFLQTHPNTHAPLARLIVRHLFAPGDLIITDLFLCLWLGMVFVVLLICLRSVSVEQAQINLLYALFVFSGVILLTGYVLYSGVVFPFLPTMVPAGNVEPRHVPLVGRVLQMLRAILLCAAVVTGLTAAAKAFRKGPVSGKGALGP